MQLKGLVRFFTVLLIIYSLYQLSFTFFVRSHEKKMEVKARAFIKASYQSALEKYPNNKDSQAIYQETLEKAYQERLKNLLDSTKDVTITYGINGAVTYQKAKEEELNLGLDLQGGMNVTLEVEMTGLLNSLASNSKDPNFQASLVNADKRKANSDADFITLFIEEYRKLEPTRPLAALFAAGSSGANKIDIKSSDKDVETYIRNQAKEAFETTFDRLSKRIDQFGVAQPNITASPDKGVINVELPGVKDKERVRANLQSTAKLEFWELYTAGDQVYAGAWQKTFDAFSRKYGSGTDSLAAKDTVTKNDSINKKDTGDKLSTQLGKTDSAGKQQDQTKTPGLTLQKYLDPSGFQPYEKTKDNQPVYPASVGTVETKDTSQFRIYLEEFRSFFPKDVVFVYGTTPKDKNGRATSSRLALYALRTYGRTTAKLDGDVVTDAAPELDQFGKVEIRMTMNSTGAAAWKKLTEDNLRKPVAVVLDNVVQTAPNVNTVIEDGISTISGNYTNQEASDLSKILKIGKLPAPAKIVAEQEVGPTLGKKAIRGGSLAFLISFVVIFLLMLVYYNTSGWIANIALILNLLFTVGVLAGFGATLTAPGIAGLVLTIGMAVDTNVIIYERIKEELARGKGYIPAINEGYKRSLPPVLDAHVTVFLTAIILFYFGLGPVKGFATTQMIGIFLSLFCGILVSRWITEWFTNKKKHLEYFTSTSRRVFKHAKFKFIEYRKYAYIISFVVLGLGIASYFNGFDEGVEFKGGRSYKVRFDKPVDVELARNDLRVAFENESPIIKTIGDNATLNITTAYKINSTQQNTDSLVEYKLMEGLKNYLPAGITYEKFDKNYKQGSQKVLPTISDDLKKGAVKATVIAMLIIFLYIFLRFRDWRYSLGTIIALLHDVLVTLIVFSFARTIVPFPLEIDQHFIAAVLTVIGFSMNDTVIVFDRIREDSRMMPNAPRGEVINKAINETLSRTIMTSLTVFLTILILFLVGGEVTKGFAFAMLIGVITGTYSSIFVAAPILVDLGGKRPLGKAAPKTKTTAPKV